MSTKTISKMALANMKQNRSRNILTGIAIALTSILVVTVLSVGYGMLSVEFSAVNKIYPRFHAMYRQVNKENTERLQQHGMIEELGVREDAGIISKNGSETIFSYMDETALELSKIELEKGTIPKSKDEIVVSEGMLKKFNLKAELGSKITLNIQPITSKGYGMEKKAEFTISGILPTTGANEKKGIYAGLVSKEYMEEIVPVKEQEYRVYLRLDNVDSMTTDQIEEIAKEIGSNFDVKEDNIVMNSEYLYANYVDPAFYTGIIAIVAIIMLAGVLTIYSIYYVSMINKVKEFGKLKALGTTKRQIRKLVFREGLFVSIIAIPVGLVIGVITTKIVMVVLVNSTVDNPLSKEISRIVKSGEVSYIHPVILLSAIVVTLATVTISLIKPMVVASKISSIEAMRYDGEMKEKRKTRKGYSFINLYRLTCSNLSRNKKKTAITIFTLGATGILFIVISTLLACSKPTEVAKERIYGDFSLSVNSRSGDEMNPEKDWKVMQQNNPLNKKLEQKITSMKGVKELRKTQRLSGALNQDDKDSVSITGIDRKEEKQFLNGLIEGNVTYDDLLNGDKVILNKNYLRWYPEWKVGSKIKVILNNGEKEIKKTLEIAAIGEYSEAFNGGVMFLVPKEAINKLSDYNTVYNFDIVVEDKHLEEVKTELSTIISDSNEKLTMESYQEIVEEWEGVMHMTSRACYAFMTILGMVGILNLINTMINSIYTRRRELGMLQTIGMSNRQLMMMLQMEGMFYTIGTFIVSLGIGNIFGYMVFIYAKNNGILGISKYHYPTMQTLILIITIILIQVILALLVSKNYHKQSLIERIRITE